YAYTSVARTANQEFELRVRPVRVANAQYDAYLGRMSLARTQIDRTLRTLPESRAKGLVGTLLEGNLYAAASRGAKSRHDSQAARDYVERAQASYRRVIAQDGSDPALTQVVAVTYKSLGLLYQAHLDFGMSATEAREALEKYLELAPNAPDRAAMIEKIRELSRGPVVRPNSARPAESPSNKDGRPACAFGMYWSSAKFQCTRIGE